MLDVVAALVVAYALGNVNPAYLLGRLRGFDIRLRGTRNAGTMNTLYSVGALPALVVFLVDAGKGLLGFWLGLEVFVLSEWWVYVSSLFVVVGHRYPVWLGFKGGKGVAAGVGLVVGSFVFRGSLRFWLVFVVFLVVVYVVMRYVLRR